MRAPILRTSLLDIDDELQLLRGTSLHAVTVQWKAQVDGDFGELEELQLPSPSEDGCSTARDALGGFLTKEGYLWALGTVRDSKRKASRAGRFTSDQNDVWQYMLYTGPCACWDTCGVVRCCVLGKEEESLPHERRYAERKQRVVSPMNAALSRNTTLNLVNTCLPTWSVVCLPAPTKGVE